MLLVDSREPATYKEAPWVDRVVTLKAGDFLDTETGLLVERKTANDFLGSISSGRLFDQCGRLARIGRPPVLLIHGSLLPDKDLKVVADGRKTRWGYYSIMMCLCTVQLGGILVVRTQRQEWWVADAIAHLRKWSAKPGHGRVRQNTERSIWNKPSNSMQAMSLIAGGHNRSGILLDEYETIANAIANMENWPSLKGIGIKTVAHAQKVLGISRPSSS